MGKEETGSVALVGAGPGDPELLTLKALKAIGCADVVVHDRLVSDGILALIPAGTARLDVGKAAGRHPVPQEEICRILVGLARSGRRVVRLKGGDPFLFGRGGEEAMALATAGIPFQVVPGITSAQGCAASRKLPLTYRTLATGVRFVTGHTCTTGSVDLDWRGLADPMTTLVVYMGLSSMREIAQRLIAEGREASTPVLAVSRGTQPGERHVTTRLGRVVEDVAAAGLVSPTLFFIGEVVGIAAHLTGGVDDGMAADRVAAE
jgi:uroporphyrin-III C-methyltransferase